jgi:hypothetical protein
VGEGQARSGGSLLRKMEAIQDNIKAKVDKTLSVVKGAPQLIQENMGVILERMEAKMDTTMHTGQERIEAIQG